MLGLVSSCLILLITSMVICYTHIKRKYLSNMTGMIVSMSNSMMSSLAFGTIFGIYIQDKDLTLPTIVSVSIGMLVGYITGRQVSLLASLEGITAGIMGGMMGAMLGVMTQPRTTEMMIYFIDVIYLLANLVLFRVIDEETGSYQKGASKKSHFIIKLFVLIVLLVSMCFLVSLNLFLFSYFK